MSLVGKEGGLVEGGGGKSFVVGVRRRAIRVPFLAKVRFALLVLVELLLLLLPTLVLVLVICIIGTLCNKMTRLIALEACTLAP